MSPRDRCRPGRGLACAATSTAIAMVLAACGGVELTSRPLDREITIDGDVTDWGDLIVPLEKKDVAVGLMNDERDLYFCLTTTDRSLQAQMVFRGLTLWLDHRGGKAREFGIRYPVGLFGSGSGPGPGDTEERREYFERMVKQSAYDLEIVGEDNELLAHVVVAESEGVEARIALVSSVLVYELKVPLASTGSREGLGIGTSAGAKIGVGLQTPEPEAGTSRRSMPGGPLPGGPGGNPGGGSLPGGMRRPPEYEPLDVWAEVQLAG